MFNNNPFNEYRATLSEGLKGDQHKLDHDKDGDIDGKDFAALRGKKKPKDKEENAKMNPKVDDKTAKASAVEAKEDTEVNEMLGALSKKKVTPAMKDRAAKMQDEKPKDKKEEGYYKDKQIKAQDKAMGAKPVPKPAPKKESLAMDEGKYVGGPSHTHPQHIGTNNGPTAKKIKVALTKAGHSFSDHGDVPGNKASNKHYISMKDKEGHAALQDLKKKHMNEGMNEGKYVGGPSHTHPQHIGTNNGPTAKKIKVALTKAGHSFSDHSHLPANKKINRHYISMKDKEGHAALQDLKKKHMNESTGIRAKLMAVLEGDRAKHYKGAAKAEDPVRGNSNKKMMDAHGKPTDAGFDDEEGHDDAAKAGRAGPKAKARNSGDATNHGDKKVINKVKEAYASMYEKEEVNGD